MKVFAASESLAGILRHPNGQRFRSHDQGAEWPNDTFTQRRIAEGSLRTDGPASGDPPPPDETKNPREQAAANKQHSETNGNGKPVPQPEPRSEPRSRSQQPPPPAA
ncbi:MAG TPA: hypothetical protein VM867_05965 [Xanthobacteraceae bacterium]|nr:hypothetical protein [Xanthobacteraceae bacterium]